METLGDRKLMLESYLERIDMMLGGTTFILGVLAGIQLSLMVILAIMYWSCIRGRY